MQNRNFFKNTHNKTNSIPKFDQNSINISNSKNYNFLNDQFNDNLPSPINKMKFELSPNISEQDILNYSSNTYINQKSSMNHRSCIQSPQKQNKLEQKMNYFAPKKYSIPDARILTETLYKQESSWNQNFKKHQSSQIVKPLRKLNTKNHHFREENQEESSQRYHYTPEQCHSQKLIECNSQNNLQSQKYNNLAKNYQQLERQYHLVRQENQKLKKSKDELMNENIMIKRQSSDQMQNFSNEIQNLKEQIYRMQMERQQMPTNRTVQSNRLTYSRSGSILSARGNNVQNQDQVNLFYVEQLQKQNDQLMRQNRRLNEIIMKRLKHSIAE